MRAHAAYRAKRPSGSSAHGPGRERCLQPVRRIIRTQRASEVLGGWFFVVPGVRQETVTRTQHGARGSHYSAMTSWPVARVLCKPLANRGDSPGREADLRGEISAALIASGHVSQPCAPVLPRPMLLAGLSPRHLHAVCDRTAQARPPVETASGLDPCSRDLPGAPATGRGRPWLSILTSLASRTPTRTAAIGFLSWGNPG